MLMNLSDALSELVVVGVAATPEVLDVVLNADSAVIATLGTTNVLSKVSQIASAHPIGSTLVIGITLGALLLVVINRIREDEECDTQSLVISSLIKLRLGEP